MGYPIPNNRIEVKYVTRFPKGAQRAPLETFCISGRHFGKKKGGEEGLKFFATCGA